MPKATVIENINRVVLLPFLPVLKGHPLPSRISLNNKLGKQPGAPSCFFQDPGINNSSCQLATTCTCPYPLGNKGPGSLQRLPLFCSVWKRNSRGRQPAVSSPLSCQINGNALQGSCGEAESSILAQSIKERKNSKRKTIRENWPRSSKWNHHHHSSQEFKPPKLF